MSSIADALVWLILVLAVGGGAWAAYALSQRGKAKAQERAEAERRLAALREAEELAVNELELLILAGHSLSAWRGLGSEAVNRSLLDALSEIRARGSDLELRLLEESRRQNLELTEASLNLKATLDSLGRTNVAAQALYTLTATPAPERTEAANEVFATHSRVLQSALDELAGRVQALRREIQAHHETQLRLAG